jgi:hypothetical protein
MLPSICRAMIHRATDAKLGCSGSSARDVEPATRSAPPGDGPIIAGDVRYARRALLRERPRLAFVEDPRRTSCTHAPAGSRLVR